MSSCDCVIGYVAVDLGSGREWGDKYLLGTVW